MARSAKETALRTITQLSDEASWHDVRYAVYVCWKIERGLQDAEAGNLIDHDVVMRELDEWLKSLGPK